MRWRSSGIRWESKRVPRRNIDQYQTDAMWCNLTEYSIALLDVPMLLPVLAVQWAYMLISRARRSPSMHSHAISGKGCLSSSFIQNSVHYMIRIATEVSRKNATLTLGPPSPHHAHCTNLPRRNSHHLRIWLCKASTPPCVFSLWASCLSTSSTNHGWRIAALAGFQLQLAATKSG